MDDTAFESQLQRSLHAGVDTLQPAPGLVETGMARGARARRRQRYAVVAGAAAVAVAAGATAYYLPAPDDTRATQEGGSPTTCRPDVVDDVLPAWARAGFSDPTPRVPHILGDRKRIIAILFADPLYAAPVPADRGNKILWVPAPSDEEPDVEGPPVLEIDATRAGTDQVVHRAIDGGPGPSYVDLPEPGCWRLELRWGSGDDDHDTLDLVYVAPPS